MKTLFWGFFFVYLNFNLNVNGHSLNLLPDFVGYILLLRGIRELEEESSLFAKARPFAVGMAVYEAILWVGALLGVASGGLVGSLLGVISLAASLYISWVLVQGVREIEAHRAAELHGALLYSRWKLLAVLQAITWLLTLMANLANLSALLVLAGVLAIVGIVVLLLFLLAWHKTAAAYEALSVEQELE